MRKQTSKSFLLLTSTIIYHSLAQSMMQRPSSAPSGTSALTAAMRAAAESESPSYIQPLRTSPTRTHPLEQPTYTHSLNEHLIIPIPRKYYEQVISIIASWGLGGSVGVAERNFLVLAGQRTSVERVLAELRQR